MLRIPLKQTTGPLTRELVQTPGNFGLGKVPARMRPAATVPSVCGYCATGCQLKVHLDESGSAINLTPQPGYPVNLGMACPKGWQALDPLDSPDRATTPLLRDATGALVPVDWQTAIDTFASRFQSIRKNHGRESAAFLSTGQIPFEEMAYLGCLWKFGMGFLDGDANTRQCMATAVTAYKQSFGFDAPPATYADFEESDVIILVGANLCIAHPILWQRVMSNRRNPEIIVIDARATETAQMATRHIAINPKGDLALLYALAHCILRDGRIDPVSIANTEGIAELTAFLQDYPPTAVSGNTGLSPETIEALARTVSEPGKRVSWWWTMGVNQSHEGVRTATTKAVRKAPGIALSDFRIFQLLAHAWGCGPMFGKWTAPEAVFKILRDLTRDRPCDITGIRGYNHLDEQGGIQWPWPAASSNPASDISNSRERRLFEDGNFHTASGKAKLLFSPPAELPEPTDDGFPFTLLTGRGTSSQWHTLTRTGKSEILRKLCPSHAYVEIHPDDAAALGLEEGSPVIIRSRRAEIRATAYLAPTVRRGQVFLPMHYPEVNRFTHPSFDPHSRQPNYKCCAVSVSAP